MPDILPFKFEDNDVRIVADEKGEPWFIAKDVCGILGLTDTSMSVGNLEEDEKGTSKVCTAGGNQVMTIISESGLYALVIRSNKPKAKKFRKWLTSEVLPSIRKTGSYSISGKFKVPTKFSEALFLCAQLQADKEANAHKVEAYDIFLTADNAQTMNEVAKSLKTGRNKLFALLRERGYLMRNNLPFQQYMDAELFVVREITIEKGDYVENKTQTLVTAKGIDVIKDLLYGQSAGQLETVITETICGASRF